MILVSSLQQTWWCWYHLYSKRGDVGNICTADVVMLVTSLQQTWWCWQHLYSTCGDVGNISTAHVVMLVTSLQQTWWCWQHLYSRFSVRFLCKAQQLPAVFTLSQIPCYTRLSRQAICTFGLNTADNSTHRGLQHVGLMRDTVSVAQVCLAVLPLPSAPVRYTASAASSLLHALQDGQWHWVTAAPLSEERLQQVTA
jgi:hypothetical protein